MSAPQPIPADLFLDGPDPAKFLVACSSPNRLIYFVLNVGDGDTQLMLLPEIDGGRRAIVVDVAQAQKNKLPELVLALQATGLLRPPHAGAGARPGNKVFPLVVGTHPHDDHIGGMADFLNLFGVDVAEYWDPGYYHPTGAFIETMKELEDQPHIIWSQPSSGMRRFIDDTRVTVLAPAVALKNQYDSYGVDPNNASITLKVEYPYARVQERTARVAGEPVAAGELLAGRLYARIPRVRSLVLGADAQAQSWAHVQSDFPALDSKHSPVFDTLKMARGTDPLAADVFKVPHHASKRGIYLELIELLDPTLTLVSSVGGGGKYGFPHAMAQDAIREAKQKIAAAPAVARKPDFELGLYYTSDRSVSGGTESDLGTIAVIVHPASNQPMEMWRFGDGRDDSVDLNRAQRLYPRPK